MSIECTCVESTDECEYVNCRKCTDRRALCDRSECQAIGRLADVRVEDELPLCWMHAIDDECDPSTEWQRTATVEVPALTEEMVIARIEARSRRVA